VSAPDDWRMLRAARLSALRDSPAAFASSFACESKWKKPAWQRLFDNATWVVARQDKQQVIGLAKSVVDPERTNARYIESAWVAPAHRRQGLFRRLLEDLARRESAAGVTDLSLWVLEDNHNAQRAYEALGFEPTGKRQFLLAFGKFEQQLRMGVERLLESQP
jgi:ribosomal protein S18 acetylase RimI-like enzyme